MGFWQTFQRVYCAPNFFMGMGFFPFYLILTSFIKYKCIPKSILRAQGYYEGQPSIWIPKTKPTSLTSEKVHYSKNLVSSCQPNSSGTNTMYQPSIVKQVWFPKKPITRSPTIQEHAQILQCVLLHKLSQNVALWLLTTTTLWPPIYVLWALSIRLCLIPFPY